ncbi:MAG: carbohydrate kinase family protein, partial [Chloroflexota bacterium]|nr:carbohydrate kinase family protein [Chloroflexota bacterium]
MIAAGPVRIAVVGDCLFDVSVRTHGTPAPGTDTPADVELLPGGQGANVAVRLARRGARVRLVTPMADDDAGSILRSRMHAEHVEVAALVAPRTGYVVALVDDAGERTMLSARTSLPRGVTVRHEVKRQLVGTDWVHLCGQSLTDPAGGGAVAAVAGALPPGVVRSADAGSPGADADTIQVLRDRVAASRVALLFCGRDVARAILGTTGRTAERAADGDTTASM